MSTPAWRAEKSAALLQHLCQLLRQAPPPDSSAAPVVLRRADFGFLLWNATKLYCDATEDAPAGPARTWSPELPAFLLDHPEQCAETLGLVADPDYRDPYYDELGRAEPEA